MRLVPHLFFGGGTSFSTQKTPGGKRVELGSRHSFPVQAGQPGVVEKRFIMFFYFSGSSKGVKFGIS